MGMRAGGNAMVTRIPVPMMNRVLAASTAKVRAKRGHILLSWRNS